MLWKELVAFVRDHASRVYGHVPQPGDTRGIVFECSFKNDCINDCMGGLSARQGAASCNKTFACCDDQPICGITLLLHQVATRVRLLRPLSIGARIEFL